MGASSLRHEVLSVLRALSFFTLTLASGGAALWWLHEGDVALIEAALRGAWSWWLGGAA